MEKKVLDDYYKLICKKIKEEQLVNLSDNEYIYKGLNVLDFVHFSKINPKFQKFNKFNVLDDIRNCIDDLRLFTAKLYLYRPYINDPTKETVFTGDGEHSTYFQNEYDWKYSSYISCCYEKLYNFWDRIGDSLAYYLDVNLKEWQVDFAKVMDKLTEDGRYGSSHHFNFLKDFKTVNYKYFNEVRREVVHYSQFEASYQQAFVKNFNSKIDLEKQFQEKNKMPEYFKKKLEEACDGYFHAYHLIKEFA
jgi:hypothetical protein